MLSLYFACKIKRRNQILLIKYKDTKIMHKAVYICEINLIRDVCEYRHLLSQVDVSKVLATNQTLMEHCFSACKNSTHEVSTRLLFIKTSCFA